MIFARFTPFRQLGRSYRALLNLSDKLDSLLQYLIQAKAAPTQRDGFGERLSHLEAALNCIPSSQAELQSAVDDRFSRAFAAHLYAPAPSGSATGPFLNFQTCSFSDFNHPRFLELCRVLHHPPVYQRKLWEWVFVFHHLERLGMLAEGKRGLGFGVGQERLPSVFANCGVEIVATDAPPEVGMASGWVSSGEHSATLSQLRFADIISDEEFERRVTHQSADMNAIGDQFRNFDFTWSCCSVEHLGSLDAGIEFIFNSLKTLRPGGVAVHTTEFNLSSNRETLAEGKTVLYRQCDMNGLVERVRSLGHSVEPFTVAPDSHYFDFYVDLPPYVGSPHLKIRLDNHVTTSAGIVITTNS